MRALLDDAAAAHDEDQISVADGREAMRNDEARPVRAQSRHRVLHESLGAGIDRARRLVEDQ